MQRLRQTNVDRYRAEQAQKTPQKKVEGLEGFIRTLLGDEPLPTQKAIFYEQTPVDDVLVAGYMGQLGSGKTNLLGLVGITRCLFQPGYRVMVGRADYNDLVGTTAAVMESMLQNLPPGVLMGREKSPPMRWTLRPIFDGPESTITFMGLKERPSSYNFHCALIDEADEVDEKIAREIPSRIRSQGYDDYLALYSFNPPPKSHWLYNACTGRDAQDVKISEPWMRLYKGIPRENAKHLPNNYYESRGQKMSEDQYQRYIENQWGSVHPGTPVYKEFKYLVHSRERIEYDPDLPLWRFWDFGYNWPVCLWAQPTPALGLRILREEIGRKTEIVPFARKCIRITNEHYWEHTRNPDEGWNEFADSTSLVDWGDPAAKQKKDTGSTLGRLLECGIRLRFLPGKHKIRDTCANVRTLLQQLDSDGEPALLFDRHNCMVVIEAMKGGYHLADDGETPVKDGFYDNPADALRYGVTFGLTSQGVGSPGRRDDFVPDSLSEHPEYER